jgi:NAD(P)H dehydrogenase (quinone)
MSRVLVIYDSKTGHTKRMAEAVAEGAREAGAETATRTVDEVQLEEMAKADALILGSPTHFGGMSEGMKRLIVKSLGVWGQLDGKVGAAFTSSLYPAGGNETTVLSLIHALMIHGMVIMGNSTGSDSYYGGTSFGSVSENSLTNSRALGKRVAEFASRLS